MNRSSKHTWGALRLVRRFGRPHRRWLTYGMLATVAVVAIRLALPWPLKWIMELVTGDPAGGYALLPEWPQELLFSIASFVGMSTMLGFFEYRQRVSLKQYAAATVHSLRESALRTITTRAALLADDGPDLISRIVSDTARIKAELSGILLHATQNSLLYLGICLVFLFISPILGVFFLIGGILTMIIGAYTSTKVSPVSFKQREKEGDYAAVVQSAVEQGYLDIDSSAINEESEEREVRATRLIARSTWAIHVSLASVTAFALWFAFIEIERGALTVGELFLFMAYVLTGQRRMVQFGRQIARMGKMVANLTRLGELVDQGFPEGLKPLLPLGEAIVMRKVRLWPVQRTIRSRALHRFSITLRRGENLVVLGRSGSGKSALLRILAGLARPRGRMFWDGNRVRSQQLYEASHIRFLPQVNVFRRQTLGSLLGVTTMEEIDEELEKVLGLRRVIRMSVKGLDTKFSSSMLTTQEARGVMLYSILTDEDASTWLLDAVTEGLSRKKSIRLFKKIVECSGDRLVIVSVPFATGIHIFDRVLVLKKGQLVFDGPPLEWQSGKEA